MLHKSTMRKRNESSAAPKIVYSHPLTFFFVFLPAFRQPKGLFCNYLVQTIPFATETQKD